jgi:hypothetical protein
MGQGGSDMGLKIHGILVCGLLFSTAALAQTAELPNVAVGDTWLFQRSLEHSKNGTTETKIELVVSRVTSSRIFHSLRVIGSRQTPPEMISLRDWSRARSINGVETIVFKPLDFPLKQGRTWSTEYEEINPEWTDKVKLAVSKVDYKVVGIESVTVPSGTFKAWKIEGEGTMTLTLKPGEISLQSSQRNDSGSVSTVISKNVSEKAAVGKIFVETWYAPETKNYIKHVYERYDPAGFRASRETRELISFKVGSQPAKD